MRSYITCSFTKEGEASLVLFFNSSFMLIYCAYKWGEGEAEREKTMIKHFVIVGTIALGLLILVLVIPQWNSEAQVQNVTVVYPERYKTGQEFEVKIIADEQTELTLQVIAIGGDSTSMTLQWPEGWQPAIQSNEQKQDTGSPCWHPVKLPSSYYRPAYNPSFHGVATLKVKIHEPIGFMVHTVIGSAVTPWNLACMQPPDVALPLIQLNSK